MDIGRRKGDASEIAVLRKKDISQPEKSVPRGLEFLFHQEEPLGMGEVARREEGDSFDLGPVGHRIEGHVPRRGPRKFRMYMKVGNESHNK